MTLHNKACADYNYSAMFKRMTTFNVLTYLHRILYFKPTHFGWFYQIWRVKARLAAKGPCIEVCEYIKSVHTFECPAVILVCYLWLRLQ